MEGLEIRKISKTYDGKKYVLKDVSLDFMQKGILAIIGRNGAGKTTLIRILATELTPTKGSAYVDGIDVVNDPTHARELMAIVPQEARTIPWMNPKQQILSYLLYRGFSYKEASSRALSSIKKLNLGQYADKLSRTLSGGTKRKVMVATVLASEARIIFLDEPTTGLDPISRRELWTLLVKLKKDYLIVLTTHYLEEAEYLADKIAIIDNGRLIISGSIDELRKKAGHEYSIRIDDSKELKMPKGVNISKIEKGYQILTSQKQAFAISEKLMAQKIKFSTNPVSLEDLFYYFAKRSINDEEEKEEGEWQ
jgi:ABC-2 type transport system ATP-binding protein